MSQDDDVRARAMYLKGFKEGRQSVEEGYRLASPATTGEIEKATNRIVSAVDKLRNAIDRLT